MPRLPSPPAECVSQQHYFELWSHELADTRSPTVLAELGGRLADRAAWVFVAGYQGALRQCFPTLVERTGWASYLVSEARDDKTVPTCYVRENATQERVLDGTKNWVAASTHLQSLVVNATVESDAAGTTAPRLENVFVEAYAPGVSVIEKPSGRFLPELVVARAEFKRAALSEDALLRADQTFAPLFGLIEARCLLVALAGHFSQLAPQASKPAEALLLAAGLVTAELSTEASVKILLEAMDLLVEWFEAWHGTEQPDETPEYALVRRRWSEDQRLLQMHRPLLHKARQAAE